jgi:hypothetical protein
MDLDMDAMKDWQVKIDAALEATVEELKVHPEDRDRFESFLLRLALAHPGDIPDPLAFFIEEGRKVMQPAIRRRLEP